MPIRTILCKKTIRKVALLDQLLNTASGIMGYFARRFSLKRKKPIINVPNRIKQMTFGLFQGNIDPPKSSPKRSRRIIVRIERVPNQSMALRPSPSFVRGLCTSRKKSNRTNVIPHMGTLIQKHQRQLWNCVKAPPISGPVDPARAHTNPLKPKYNDRLRTLKRSEMEMIANCIRPPLAAPCSARPAISIGILALSAASMLAAANNTTAVRRMGLRPQMSLHFAQIGPVAALASR